MRAARFSLSPNGRVLPGPFVAGALAVYALGAMSHLLTAPDVMARASLWPFAAAQAALIWCWYALHAQRLHDIGRGAGLAAGIAALYALSIVLLVVLAVAFYSSGNSPLGNPNAAASLGLILILYIVSTLTASSDYGLGWAVVALLTAIAFLPTLVALIFTCWAATRPSAGVTA